MEVNRSGMRLGVALLAGAPIATAVAQRVELGLVAGWYQQTPPTFKEYFLDGGSVESVREVGRTVGGHVSLVGPRFGITASVFQARATTSR